HHFLETGPGQLNRRAATSFRKRWKVLARQRLHSRIEAIGSHFDAALVFDNLDVCFRQRLDDLVELLCRKRERTTFGDSRMASTAKSHLEIRREQLHLLA